MAPQERAPDIWAGVLYLVGRTALLSPLVEVAEVLDLPQEITRVPAAKSWVCGIANNRGTLLPIFDLQGFLFGVPTPRDARNRVLVARHDDLAYGLLVADVVGIRHFEASSHATDAPELGAGIDTLISGSFGRRGEVYPVLSMHRLGLDERFNSAAA